VKSYKKKYLTKRKGEYLCKSYYLYLSKEMAEPLLGRDLRVTRYKAGVLIEPFGKLDIESRSPTPQIRG
jgi:hypothetical protein